MCFRKETLKSFPYDFPRPWLYFVWSITVISINFWNYGTRPVDAATTLTALILEPKIIVQSEKHTEFQYVKFDVPEAGRAVLSVLNGAKYGAAPDRRIEGAEITLNGQVIVKPEKLTRKTDIIKLDIPIMRGTNRLGVKLPDNTGNRLSVWIDAPADAIRLEPVIDTLRVGGLLQVRAMLTGLGRPVRDAAIQFSIDGLGNITKQSAWTGRAGVAITTLHSFPRAGSGQLTAKTIGGEPFLSATQAIQVVESSSIALESMVRVKLAPGIKRRVPFLVRLRKAGAENAEITFEQWIDPDTGGIRLTPSGPVAVKPTASPHATQLMEKTLEAIRPGVYTVIARATVKQTGETAGTRMKVNVVEPKPAKVLVINPPAFVPAAVTVARPTPVRFAAVASGVTKYPSSLELQEFDPVSDQWKKVKLPDDDHQPEGGQLRDDGRNGDLIAGDRVYARKLTVTGEAEGEKRYRVVFNRSDKPGDQVIVSSSRTLKISRFPVGAYRGKVGVIKDDKTGRKFVAKQVTAGFYSDLPEKEIQTIVEDATLEATGAAGHIIGYLQQIHVVQVGLEVKVPPNTPDDEAEAAQVAAVKAAVAELNRHPMVRYAHPNIIFELAELPQVSPDGGNGVICSDTQQDQWAAYRIRAHESWPLTGTLKGPRVVAVVDTGVESGNDLCWGESTAAGSTRSPPGCDPVNVLSGDPANGLGTSTDTDEEDHGTGVAGIIAARHHGSTGSTGITGIAHGLPIISFDVGATLTPTDPNDIDVRNQIIRAAARTVSAADTLEVGIINFSGTTADADPNLKSAFEYATCHDDTPGDADCDCESDGTGRCRLVIAAVGNPGIEIDFFNETVYPCSWSNLPAVMCVAGTDNSNLRSVSNSGIVVDMSAPGAGVCTTSANSASGYRNASGSTYAVAHASGAAAVLWSKKQDLTAVEVADRLKNTAKSWGPPDNLNPLYVGKMGSGLLDLYKAVRYPARLVLVLDKSGSMAWSSHPDDPGCSVYAPPPTGCGPSRWEIIERAVAQVLAVAKEHVNDDDQFAVVLFDSSAGNLKPFEPLDEDAILNFVTSFGPGGGTSIGEGVTALESDLNLGASDHHRTIMLFTDGDQNHPSYLVPNDPQLLINQTANSTGGPEVHEFAPGVSICPFALRADDVSGTLGSNYLQSISDQRCDGLMNSTISIDPNDDSLVQFFLQVLHDALIGDKLELVKVTGGLIQNGQKPQDVETFMTSRDDLAFSLLITWPEPGNGLRKAILSKDRVDFPITGTSNQIHTSSGDTYMAITMRRPFCNADNECVKSEGEWTLQLLPSFEVSKKFTYNLFVTADNASIASEFRVSQAEPGIGSPLRITASLTEARKPISGLSSGSVRAFLSRPDASLGNVLSKAQVNPVKPPDADPISAAGRKASAMLADPGLRPSILKAIRPGAEIELILKESEPGLYEASYYDTKFSGIYHVRFLVNGHSAGNGKYTRTYSTARTVEVIADAKATLKTVKVSAITPCHLTGGCYAITLTPIDAYGNLLGPGKASFINVAKFSGRIIQPTADELNGSYTVHIGYPIPPQENPVIDIRGIRIPVDLGKLSTPGSLRVLSDTK